MGQKITVKASVVGDVVLFDLDRSLTGQDGAAYTKAPPVGATPSSELATILFESDEHIETVHVMSNTVSIKRSGGWTNQAIDSAADAISNLFVVNRASEEMEPDQKLRDENYNATLTSIRAHNPDLWVIRVRPDQPIDTFKPGQYTTLALGFWEPRADEALEDFGDDPSLRSKMARRSYSVSSSMVDEAADLVSADAEDVEFYIVQVRPDEAEVPSLTPRLFSMKEGDRLFMGRKFTGRYTLDGVEPTDNVVFLSTGTGEAPQNNMAAELLRRGHQGRILNMVCVRYHQDLAYLNEQALVQSRFSNYTYVAITTREPGDASDKVYIQDLVKSGVVEDQLGAPLDPSTTHAFLCGNPSMIGLPKWNEDRTMDFPDVVGVCELLHERGFKIDHRKERGNVHYEEYWKGR